MLSWSKDRVAFAIHCHSNPKIIFTFLRKLQSEIDFDDEELNQYYYSFERKDDLDDDENLATILNEMKMKLKKNRLDGKSEDSFLTEYQDELALALHECVVHHQKLVEICGMLERFYNKIVLVKSLQVTLQICNLAYVFTTVKSVNISNSLVYH